MPFRYFVKQLLLPPGILLLFLLAAWWLRHSRPRLAGVLFAVGLGGMWLMSLPVMVEWSARTIEREPALAPHEWSSLSERADAIVLLGSGRERGDPAWGRSRRAGARPRVAASAIRSAAFVEATAALQPGTYRPHGARARAGQAPRRAARGVTLSCHVPAGHQYRL